MWVAYAIVFFGTIGIRKVRHIYVANWFFGAFIITVAVLHLVNSAEIPAGFMKTLFDPSVTWQFKTEASEHIAGRQIPLVQGRTLGGSSAVNGGLIVRGQRIEVKARCVAGKLVYQRVRRRKGHGDGCEEAMADSCTTGSTITQRGASDTRISAL